MFILVFSLFLQSSFADEKDTWIVGAEKFTMVKGQNQNAVTEGISSVLPKSILENLNQVLTRNIKVDEKLERTRYELRKKRQSLYLQLSSEYKKRDALFLSYSGNKLKKKLSEHDKEINKIKKQIDDNILELKKSEENLMRKAEPESKNQDNFFKNIITNEKSVLSSEQIRIYNDDPESLVSVSEKAQKLGYKSTLFESDIYDKGINALLTGNITEYDGYVSVAVDLYMYPGGIKIGSAMDVGSINDLEIIANSIVNQLIPVMTNSLPVSLIFSITPEEVIPNVEIYIDDILQKNNSKKITINSGIHSFKVVAKGYISLSTNYYFEGNTKYNININMEPKTEGLLYINMKDAMVGDVYINGVLANNINEKKSQISINGNKILGQFISEDGQTDFFYVPENLCYQDSNVLINPKPIDRGKMIDTRRRWMYGAYSGLIVSLIPMFIIKGKFNNIAAQYLDGKTDYNTAHNWEIASNVSVGVTIGAGIFWGFELIRYLIAANSVLPEKAKEVNLIDLENNKENINNDNEDLQHDDVPKSDNGDKK